MSAKLTPKAARLLDWARQRGEEGLAVAGIGEHATVDELVAQDLVRFEADETTSPGFAGRIYARRPA